MLDNDEEIERRGRSSRERESQKRTSTSQVMYQLSISIDMKRWALSSPNHWQPTATDGCCEKNIIFFPLLLPYKTFITSYKCYITNMVLWKQIVL